MSNFYPRSPCGERQGTCNLLDAHRVFLSTLSLRRATVNPYKLTMIFGNFYPRSPCGERPVFFIIFDACCTFLSTLSLRRATACISNPLKASKISIHALLAESDPGRAPLSRVIGISIHALLAESDRSGVGSWICLLYFYPRSPCGERRYLINTYHRIFGISIHALLAESDLLCRFWRFCRHTFLSTLSLRKTAYPKQNIISIHALLAESDLILSYKVLLATLFLSTLSLRRATRGWTLNINGPMKISIHALLAESDDAGDRATTETAHFYPRSPCGERHVDR